MGVRTQQAENPGWGAPLAGYQRDLVGAHLLLVNRLLKRSAKTDFAQFEPRNQMERRIVLSLHRIETGRVSELATLLGHDLAQVSRALRGLRNCGLVMRDSPREPYRLTPQGWELGDLMDVVALRREAELNRGFGLQQMFELAGMLGVMQRRASEILAVEMQGGPSSANTGMAGRGQVPLVQSLPIELASRVQSAITSLATTIARAATLAYKRQTGLSSYEWRVIANVAARLEVTFVGLVAHVGSDKAQVSRALDSLVSSGLLARVRADRAGPESIVLTPLGVETHAVLLADALRRSAVLLSDLKASQRQRLQTYLNRLIANATSMADRAEAGVEPGSGD